MIGIDIGPFAGLGSRDDGRALLEELKSIDEESLGVKAVTRRHQEATLLVEMDTPEVLWDLNTPEEYQAALRGDL